MNSTLVSSHDQIVESYRRDGYWLAPELLTPDECGRLKEEALRLLREKAAPDATVHVSVAMYSPMYYRLASDPRFVEILGAIMPEGVMFLNDKFVFKSGEQRFATPWHYDAMYWTGTRSKISVWIPLDDVDAGNGALRVVRGSHLRDWKPRPTGGVGKRNEFFNQVEEGQWDPKDDIVCAMKKGGAVFFSDKLLHASCPNESGKDRYVVISTYHAPTGDEDFDQPYTARHVILPTASKHPKSSSSYQS